MKLEVQIKQVHIRDGQPGESNGCPLALALHEVLGKHPYFSEFDLESVEVDPEEFQIHGHLFQDGVGARTRFYGEMPKLGQRFIRMFDNRINPDGSTTPLPPPIRLYFEVYEDDELYAQMLAEARGEYGR